MTRNYETEMAMHSYKGSKHKTKTLDSDHSNLSKISRDVASRLLFSASAASCCGNEVAISVEVGIVSFQRQST